jgi:regulator of sigma E protease
VRDHWNLSQWFTLALAAVAVVWLFQYLGPDGMLKVALAAFGLGLVIFIHELGHFLVAKWCDVHVETFSIGFGPAIPGCSFQHGETQYKIAWIPLGGYVKMVGEGTEADENDDDPRSFKNKSVWQRMAIISAGVVMNVILGFLCFIFVYRTHGVERQPAEVDMVDTGSPAWREGLPTGAVIEQIGNVHTTYWNQLKYKVMLSAKGEQLDVVYQLPGQPKRSVEIEPRRDKEDPHPVIGLTPPQELKLVPKTRKSLTSPVLCDSAAARATPAFQLGDEIVGTTDPENPTQTRELPLDPRNPNGKSRDYFEFRRRLGLLAGKPMVIQVRRQGEDLSATPTNVEVPPAYSSTLGLRMQIGQVTAVRNDSPAQRAGIQYRDASRDQEGDILKWVQVVDEKGQAIRYETDLVTESVDNGIQKKHLDPLRLPFELAQWASRLKTAKKQVALKVLRRVGHEERKAFPSGADEAVHLDWDDRWTFNHEVPFAPRSPLSIPELGLAYQVETMVDAVAEGSPAHAAGLKPRDVIKEVRFQEPGKEPGQSTPGPWTELDSDQWAHIFWVLQETEIKALTLRVQRANKTEEFRVVAQDDTSWPLLERGLVLMPETRLQKANNLGDAIVLGLKENFESIILIYLNLKAMVTRRISVKSVGGPILIFKMAYEIAGQDLYTLVFFLGMISINLAVINFLPIPVLDGGHMVFLIYEKIRGVPASESVRAVATYVGVFIILALIVLTFWNDIARLILGQRI